LASEVNRHLRGSNSLTAINDILLPLTSYPIPTEKGAIELVIAFARRLGSHVTALAFEMNFQPAIGLYADPAGVSGILAADRRKSAENARGLVSTFEALAEQQGVGHETTLVCCRSLEIPHWVAAEARFRDASIVPVRESQGERDIAESLVFGSGRPVLIFPGTGDRTLSDAIDTVAVAWDFSAPSARAVADAMPFLRHAKQVRFFTAVDDKPLKDARSGDSLSKYLARHGVKATMENVKSGGRRIGEVLESYVDEHNVDLLVMGAFGHSRLREFILGGATESMLARPPSWVLLSR
jgi:nucleotide-binding universal stress UspA family protein